MFIAFAMPLLDFYQHQMPTPRSSMMASAPGTLGINPARTNQCGLVVTKIDTLHFHYLLNGFLG